MLSDYTAEMTCCGKWLQEARIRTRWVFVFEDHRVKGCETWRGPGANLLQPLHFTSERTEAQKGKPVQVDVSYRNNWLILCLEEGRKRGRRMRGAYGWHDVLKHYISSRMSMNILYQRKVVGKWEISFMVNSISWPQYHLQETGNIKRYEVWTLY